MLAHQERIEASRAQPRDFLLRAHPGLADGNASLRHGIDQLQRSVQANVQRAQVAIVDADKLSPRIHCARKLLPRVHLDQRFHSQLAAEREQLAERRIAQDGDDQQKRIGVGSARLPHLPGIDDEIFAQHR